MTDSTFVLVRRADLAGEIGPDTGHRPEMSGRRALRSALAVDPEQQIDDLARTIHDAIDYLDRDEARRIARAVLGADQ